MNNGKFLKKINLDRSEKTKDIKPNIISDIDLKNIKDNFDFNIQRIKDKFSIVMELEKDNYILASEDILRSQVVLLMSAVDFYIHEIVKYGVLNIFKKKRKETTNYKNFMVNIKCVERALENPESIDWLEENIISENRKQTYMGTRRIRKALDLISSKRIYQNSIKNICLSSAEFENKFSEIYLKRNCIAHQSGRDEKTGKIEMINIEEVKIYVDITSKFIENIHKEIINDI